MLHSVAPKHAGMQHYVSHGYNLDATICSMGTWFEWRKRAKEWKRDNKLADADLAESIGVKRATVNHWLTGRREPNVRNFFALCEAMGADPGLILFGQAELRNVVNQKSAAYTAVTSSPTALPGYKKFSEKLRTFKQKRSRYRRPILIR